MIPRVIHQTGPDRDKWPDAWVMCQNTVHTVLSGYKYRFWTDHDLERFVREYFPWFLDIYLGYPEQIYRVDAARYMILYIHGGIYIDLDMEVIHDFYGRLAPDRPSIVESPFKNVEKHQNSLMASPPGHPFWLEVLRDMASTAVFFHGSVLDATGPRMLDRVIEDNPRRIRVLPSKEFNPPPSGRVYNIDRWVENDRVYTRHHCTAVWRYNSLF